MPEVTYLALKLEAIQVQRKKLFLEALLISDCSIAVVEYWSPQIP